MNIHKNEIRHLQIIRMLPGEENGLIISYNIYDSMFGKALIASTSIGICFIAMGPERVMLEELKRKYPKAALIRENAPLQVTALSRMFGHDDGDLLPLHIKGTDFQLKVWNALLQIPTGEKSTYKLIATHIGRPKASRAVGTAVGKNPVCYLIPCHRVVRSDRSLGGYRWGTDLKEKMLKQESAL
jgi:AraC family transcriptional regulator of adaptative response/methylated-DNA-[protein]-cysteine methyltransferase